MGTESNAEKNDNLPTKSTLNQISSLWELTVLTVGYGSNRLLSENLWMKWHFQFQKMNKHLQWKMRLKKPWELKLQ